MKKVLLIFLLPVVWISIGQSQLLTWTPNFPVDNDPATNIVITMDASKGNQGLLNYTPTSDVYVHIGLITDSSSNSGNWHYVKFTWGTTPTQAQATYIGNNKWTYTITGGIRNFFGVTSGIGIKKIALLFRNGTGSQVQRNADGTDMFVPVYSPGLAVRFTDPPIQPTFIPQPEPINKSVGDNIFLSAVSTGGTEMKLYLNGTLIQSAISTNTISATPTLTVAGTNIAVAEVIMGPVARRDTLQFFVSPAIPILPLPVGVRDGINYNTNNTSVTLVLYAPNKNRVGVIGEFTGSNWVEQASYQMNKTPDGNYWWITLTGLTPGTEYAFQYLVDGNLKIADPYAEKILDPCSTCDASIPATTYPNLKPYPTGIVSVLQTASPQYNWQVNSFARPDKRKLVVYELLLRDFLALHDWNTLRDTLNYLKNLGVNAIELMPFNEFDGNTSWGYNPDFYFSPDKYYGPANTLKQFIDSAHKKGIAVIMDIALNHTTGQSPLARLYWNSSTNQPAANNPWLNVTATHPFNVFNDFNHESLATKYFFSRVVEHWLQNYKLDGFRFDLSKGFTQVNSGNDVNLWSQYDASRVAIWKRYYDTLQLKSSGSYAILEHFAANNEEIELSDYGMLLWGNMAYNYQEASMGFVSNSNFENGIYTVRGWTQPHLVTYMESHDEERMMYKNLQFGNSSGTYNIRELNTALKRIEMCGAFLFTIPGPKMFWQFGEMGYDYSINHCVNGTVNDACRLDPKPIRWDYLQNIQRKRLHDVFAALINLRFHPLYKDVFLTNQITRSLAGGLKTMNITTDTSKICVVGNFDVVSQTGSVTFQTAGTWYDYLGGGTITATGAPQVISLQPGEYHVYLNRNVVNAVVTPVSSVNSPGNKLSVILYPNPGTANSIIDLKIPESGIVNIDLLNQLGQHVSKIHSGFLSKGDHQLTFGNSYQFPAGSYLLKVDTKSNSVTIKIILK